MSKVCRRAVLHGARKDSVPQMPMVLPQPRCGKVRNVTKYHGTLADPLAG
jgi:hypothetical protein